MPAVEKYRNADVLAPILSKRVRRGGDGVLTSIGGGKDSAGFRETISKRIDYN